MDSDSREWVPVVAGILVRRGKFLAVQRPQGKAFAGYWEFPGGKIEPGESAEAALQRELKEEIDVVPLDFFLWKEKRKKYNTIHVHLLFFLVQNYSGWPAPLEGQAISWYTVEEAREKPFLEADKEIVKAIELTG